MKKILTFVFAMMFVSTSFAQTPGLFSDNFLSGYVEPPTASSSTDSTDAIDIVEDEVQSPAASALNSIVNDSSNQQRRNPNVQTTDVISDIIINGLVNVKQKTVLSAISSKKWHIYYQETAREDVKKLLELGSFINVNFYFDDVKGKLTFFVEEKPYIEKIIFKGNKQISKGKLTKESVLKEKEYYDNSKFEDTKDKIITYYKNNGYTDVQLEAYPTLDQKTNKMTINFLITENKRIIVGMVSIDGVRSFKRNKVLRQVKKTKSKKVFDESLYQVDLKAVENFYKENGFMDAQIQSLPIQYNEERTQMFLTISVNEGPKYVFGNVTYTGNSAVNNKDMKKLLKVAKGEEYKQSRVNETLQGIYGAYSDKGYLQANIVPDIVRQPGTVGVADLNFIIAENSIIYAGNIYVEGLESTKDKVIRREILIKPGNPLSTSKVRRSVERIYNLGFIEGVEPQLIPTNSQDIVDLSFNVKEGRPGMISAGAGYSSVDQLVGSVQVQHMNLFGLGQRANAMVEFGEKRQNYQVDWTEPWIFDKNASLTLSAYNIERVRDYSTIADAYHENRVGGAVRIGPRISDRVSLMFGYSFENVNLYDFSSESNTSIPNVRQAVLGDRGISRDNNSSVMAQITYDTRDYAFDPTRGNRQLLSWQLASSALGGDLDFVKGHIRSSWFFPTFWKFVLSFNLSVSAIEGYNNQEVPIYEKLYVGGADTIRGYKYATEVGPSDGGKLTSVLNVEYKFPIVAQRGRTILQGVFFYDIGGAWREIQDINLTLGTEERNIRSGFGFGIRFATPVFPLRLDYGYGLNHKTGEKLQQFYFSVGNIF